MVIATSIKALLITAVAALSLWRVGTAGDGAAMFALRANVIGSELVLTLTLPAICLRLTTHLADELMNLTAFAACERCAPSAYGRSWS